MESYIYQEETGNNMVEFIGGLAILGVLLVLFILYLRTLQLALQRCSPELRTMPPGQVWLIFIPFFHFIWQFLIVGHVARSLEAEYRKRGLPIERDPGKSLGIAVCILHCCAIVPIIGILPGLASVICGIAYWSKIAGYSARIAGPPPPPVIRGSPSGMV
jgi:hypothetical protein